MDGVTLRPGRALIVATRKGIFFAEGNPERSSWHLQEPVFLGHIINHAITAWRRAGFAMAAPVEGVNPASNGERTKQGQVGLPASRDAVDHDQRRRLVRPRDVDKIQSCLGGGKNVFNHQSP